MGNSTAAETEKNSSDCEEYSSKINSKNDNESFGHNIPKTMPSTGFGLFKNIPGKEQTSTIDNNKNTEEKEEKKEEKEENSEEVKIIIPHNLNSFGFSAKRNSIFKNLDKRKAPLEIINEVGEVNKKKKFSYIKNYDDPKAQELLEKRLNSEKEKEQKRGSIYLKRASINTIFTNASNLNFIPKKKKKIALDTLLTKAQIKPNKTDIIFQSYLFFIPHTQHFKGSELSTRFLVLTNSGLNIYKSEESFLLSMKPIHIITSLTNCDFVTLDGIINKKIQAIENNIFYLEFQEQSIKKEKKNEQLNGK